MDFEGIWKEIDGHSNEFKIVKVGDVVYLHPGFWSLDAVRGFFQYLVDSQPEFNFICCTG